MATYYDPRTEFYSAYKTSGLAGMEFADENSAPSRIDFITETSADNIALVLTAAQDWDWMPIVKPDPQGFVSALAANENLIPVLFLLMPYYAAILDYEVHPQSIKTVWTQVKDVYSSQLTSDIITTIESYATQYNMPFT